MVALKIIAIMVFVVFAARLRASRQLASVRAQRLAGHPHRRLDYFLHLHRLRFCLHRRRRMQGSRSAILPIGIIATLIVCTILYIAVVVVLTGSGPVGNSDGRRRARRKHAEAPALRKCATDRADRRAAGHDFFAARLSVGPGARVVRHVPRRFATRRFQPRPQDAFALRISPRSSQDFSSAFLPGFSTSALSRTSRISARSSPSLSSAPES